MRPATQLLSILALTLVLTGPATAQMQIFLEVPGVTGAYAKGDPLAADLIQVRSFAFQISREYETGRSGSARERAGTVFEEVTVNKDFDSRSPALAMACCGGSTFTEIKLLVFAPTGEVGRRESTLTLQAQFIFGSARLTRFEQSGDDRIGQVSEELAIDFDSIRYQTITDGKVEEMTWSVLRQAPLVK